MRFRTQVGLVGRALAALALQATLVVTVGAVLSAFGAAIGVAALDASPVPGDPSPAAVAGAALVGAGLTTLVWVGEVRKRFRRGRLAMYRATRETTDAERPVVETVRRLAAQVDRPAPAVRVRETAAPLCYTLPTADGPAVVVSTGLVEAVHGAEREAVLAHEVAHLANRDHRVMRWALAPLVAAEELADAGSTGDRASDRFFGALVAWGSVGVGVFSRGREFAADAAAARLTGDPGALAGALRALDGAAADRPETDLREHARSIDALSVLPAMDPAADAGGGLAATHPATETRIERLRALEARAETRQVTGR